MITNKKKKGYIIFSDIISLYEIVDDENQLFQTFENDEDIFKNLSLYSKKLRSLSLNIYFKTEHFKKIYVDSSEDDIESKDIEDYISYCVKEKLEEDNLDHLFIKFFKVEDKKYLVFILERIIVEETIEFIVKNKLLVENIFIQAEKDYSLDDYDKLIKKIKPQKCVKIAALFCFCISLIFIGLTFHNSNLKNKINLENKKKSVLIEDLNEIKFQQEEFEKDIESLSIKLNTQFLKKEFFNDKIYKLLKIIPDEINLEYIYYEKQVLSLKGTSLSKNAFFYFLGYLEKSNGVRRSRYDYLLNKNNTYDFLIEVEVL